MPESFGDVFPIRTFVEIDTDPTARSHVGRAEVTLGGASDQKVLRQRVGLAPDGVASGAMVIRGVRETGLPGSR